MPHFSVRYTSPAALERAGYGQVIGVPFILDGRPGYHRSGSQFLIDRALGAWAPTRGVRRRDLTPQTLKNYARWLANFLEWADFRGVSLETCTYADHIHGRYQKELQKGYWSRDGKPLSALAVNSYVDQACYFLDWLAFKGKRAAFDVPTVKLRIAKGSATNSHGHRGIEIEVRQGKARQSKRRLRMPTDREIQIWVDSLHSDQEEPYGLMAETVLQSAVRRSEVLGFRVDTLPLNKVDWHISNPTAEIDDQLVLIPVTFGAKGESFGIDHGDKIGPTREINIPLHLAERLHAYREDVRPNALSKWVTKARGAKAQRERLQDSVHLFLDAKTGLPIQSWQFYAAWKTGPQPFRGWCPHFGRDWWACSTLWREVKLHEHVLKLGNNAPGALLAAAATDVIRLTIQPQLGHAHESTCFIYLRWVADMLGVALPQKYQDHLDEGDRA